MRSTRLYWKTLILCAALLMPAPIRAQGQKPDYDRANSLRNKYQGLAVNIPDRVNWIDSTPLSSRR